MKKILILAVMCGSSLLGFAQDKKDKNTASTKDGTEPKIYAVLSSGINNPNGFFGAGVDVYKQRFLVGAGIGISSWGTKLNVKGMYFLHDNNIGGAFGAALVYSTGGTLTNVQSDINSSLYVDAVLKGVTSFNLMYGKYWKVGARGRFFFLTGIASKLSSNIVTETYTGTNVPYNNTNSKKYFSTNSPGGIIASAGFQIRLNK
jgi:hypothetical protein